MSALDQLLSVQEHDTTLDQLDHRRTHLPERAALVEIAEQEADIDARRGELDERRTELARSQKRLEDEIALVEAKRVEEDARLYSGSITAPRELQALQDELATIARRTSELEDELLEILTDLEPIEEAIAALDDETRALAERRTQVESSLAAAEAEVDAQATSVRAERDDAAATLSAEVLADYETRRRQLGGIAVARLNGSSCGGCHLTLSAVEIDRIRKLPADEPATCEECGRMLVH